MCQAFWDHNSRIGLKNGQLSTTDVKTCISTSARLKSQDRVGDCHGIWPLSFSQAPTVTHLESSGARICRQLHIFLLRGGSGSWAVACCAASFLEKDYLWGGVYMTDPVVATFAGPKLTDWIQECATVDDGHKKMHFCEAPLFCTVDICTLMNVCWQCEL